MTAAEFYAHARPLVEQLATLARAWRDRAPAELAAIEAHGEFVRLAIRCDLRLSRRRTLTADLAPAEPGNPTP